MSLKTVLVKIKPRSWFVYGLTLAVVMVLLIFVTHYIPFNLASYSFWIAIGLFLIGLIALIKPLQFLHLRRRRHALYVLLFSMVLAFTALFWPTSIMEVSGSHQRLDDFLPQYQYAEYHETRLRAPMDRITKAMREVSFADMPAAVFLMRLRGLAGGQTEYQEPDRTPILDLMTKPGSGFLPLDTSDPQEIVYGMVGRPWTNDPPPKVTTPEEFLAFETKGQIKVAFNIRCVEEGDGVVRVSSETRILGNDPDTQRIFSRYWRIIYPGSAIIRRVWLDAIISRCETSEP